MSYHYESPNAVCPFYRMEHQRFIYCEGLTKDWGLVLENGSVQEAKQYKRDRCYCHWIQCPIAKMLWAQYDDIRYLRDMKGTTNASGLIGVTRHDRWMWEQEQQA